MHVIGDLDQSSSAGGPRGREERGIGGHEGSTREAFCCRGEQGDRAGAGRQLETVRTRRLWPGGSWRGFHQLGVTDEDTEAQEAEQLPLRPRFEPPHPGAAVLCPSGHALVGAISTGSCMARWVRGALVLSV